VLESLLSKTLQKPQKRTMTSGSRVFTLDPNCDLHFRIDNTLFIIQL